MAQSNIQTLIQLATADGHISDIEKDLIYNVAKSNGFSNYEIEEAFNISDPIADVTNLPTERKFDYIYNVVELMMADGKISLEEIAYCSRLAFKLGYHESVITELINDIHFKDLSGNTKDDLKGKVQNYLR